MEFSQYVVDAIVSINNVEKDRDQHAISLIKESAIKADNELDAHILNVISGSMTMTHKNKGQQFSHSLEFEGRRSFSPEDLNDGDIDILRQVTQVTESSWLRTKFAHIVWTLTKEPDYAQLSVTGYLETFIKTFNPDNWVTCYNNAEVAYHIASSMGKKTELLKQTRSTVLQKVLELNGDDPLFLSISLLELVLIDLTQEELLKYEAIIEKLFHKNTEPSITNSHLADESFSIIEKLYQRLKRDDDIRKVKEQYALYYEMRAKQLAEKKDYFRAIHNMKKACSLYQGINRNKTIDLRLLIEDWQKASLKNLHPITIKIDTQRIVDTIDEMFDGLSLSEAIVQFGRIAVIYREEDVKQQLLKEKEESFLSTMFGSNLLNNQGQTIQTLPAITNIEKNPNALRKHMIRHVAEQRRTFDSISIRMAYQHIKHFGNISKDAFDFLVHDNVIIPDNRAEIIKEGLCLALNGNLYAAMHILLPQTEHIFRHLVKMCGDTVTFLKEDGSEEYKPLSALLKSEKLLECYDENLIFTFQSIMDDPAGENLRNLNGHGLLEPTAGNGTEALSFLGLLIKLLSWYTEEAYAIRMKLFEQESMKKTDTT